MSPAGKSGELGPCPENARTFSFGEKGNNMIVQPRIFDGTPGNGDVEYFEWRDTHPDGVVANVPNPEREFFHFPIKMHRARCYTLGLAYLKPGERATEETQWKICDVSQEIVEHYLEQHFPRREIERCMSRGQDGCGAYWNPPML